MQVKFKYLSKKDSKGGHRHHRFANPYLKPLRPCLFRIQNFFFHLRKLSQWMYCILCDVPSGVWTYNPQSNALGFL